MFALINMVCTVAVKKNYLLKIFYKLSKFFLKKYYLADVIYIV